MLGNQCFYASKILDIIKKKAVDIGLSQQSQHSSQTRIETSQREARQTTVLQDPRLSHNLLVYIKASHINFSHLGLCTLPIWFAVSLSWQSLSVIQLPNVFSLTLPLLEWSLSSDTVSCSLLQYPVWQTAILNISNISKEILAHSRKSRLSSFISSVVQQHVLQYDFIVLINVSCNNVDPGFRCSIHYRLLLIIVVFPDI